MARDLFISTVTRGLVGEPGAGRLLEALSGVQVTVYNSGTTTPAIIYKTKTGATQGPVASAGATGNNPFTTGATGSAEFWAEPGAYDVFVQDLLSTPRISNKTIGWLSGSALGTGASDSAVGNDTRFTNQRVPTDGSVTIGKISGALKPSASAGVGDEALRALGTGANQATPGNDARLASARLLPTGAVTAFAGAAAPAGYLLCDGSEASRDGYSALFAVLGSTYGSGNGSTTFNVPDLRGRSPVGDDGTAGRMLSGARGEVGGEEFHTLTGGEMPNHAHAIQGTTGAGGAWGATDAIYAPHNGILNGQSVLSSFSGSDATHNNMPPYQVLNYIISV